jgi:hypothetical protein
MSGNLSLRDFGYPKSKDRLGGVNPIQVKIARSPISIGINPGKSESANIVLSEENRRGFGESATNFRLFHRRS